MTEFESTYLGIDGDVTGDLRVVCENLISSLRRAANTSTTITNIELKHLPESISLELAELFPESKGSGVLDLNVLDIALVNLAESFIDRSPRINELWNCLFRKYLYDDSGFHRYRSEVNPEQRESDRRTMLQTAGDSQGEDDDTAATECPSPRPRPRPTLLRTGTTGPAEIRGDCRQPAGGKLDHESRRLLDLTADPPSRDKLFQGARVWIAQQFKHLEEVQRLANQYLNRKISIAIRGLNNATKQQVRDKFSVGSEVWYAGDYTGGVGIEALKPAEEQRGVVQRARSDGSYDVLLYRTCKVVRSADCTALKEVSREEFSQLDGPGGRYDRSKGAGLLYALFSWYDADDNKVMDKREFEQLVSDLLRLRDGGAAALDLHLRDRTLESIKKRTMEHGVDFSGSITQWAFFAACEEPASVLSSIIGFDDDLLRRLVAKQWAAKCHLMPSLGTVEIEVEAEAEAEHEDKDKESCILVKLFCLFDVDQSQRVSMRELCNMIRRLAALTNQQHYGTSTEAGTDSGFLDIDIDINADADADQVERIFRVVIRRLQDFQPASAPVDEHEVREDDEFEYVKAGVKSLVRVVRGGVHRDQPPNVYFTVEVVAGMGEGEGKGTKSREFQTTVGRLRKRVVSWQLGLAADEGITFHEFETAVTGGLFEGIFTPRDAALLVARAAPAPAPAP